MDDTITPLYSAEEIKARIDALAADIAVSLPKDIIIIALLRGSFVFAADLIRALYAHGMRPQIDFMTLSSYGASMQSSGAVTIYRDINETVAGKDVLIIDDILESGRTLSYARNLIRERGAQLVRLAVLLEKPGKRNVDIAADYVGFVIPDHFVVGYGLDYANFYRELPFIGIVEQPA